MNGKLFFDTNILIYAYDDHEPVKQATAQTLLSKTIENENGVLSVQVLGEFFNVVTRHIKNPMSSDEAWQIIATVSILPVQEMDLLMVGRAVATHKMYRISYWDALIIAAAERAGAEEIMSEDLNDGRFYHKIQVCNPFKPA